MSNSLLKESHYDDISDDTTKQHLPDESFKKKSIKKNYFYNLFYQIFLIIVPVVVTPYVSRVLTPNGIGQYSFSFSLITYFTLFGSLGFGYYAQRAIARKQNNISEQSITFWEIIICRLIPVFLALFTNVMFCFFDVYNDYTTLMWVFNINILAIAFDIAFFYQGKEEFGKLVFRNFLIKTISVVLIFVFVKNEKDLVLYTIINALSVFFTALSMWITVFKMLYKVSIKNLHPLKHMKGTIILFLPTIAISIYTILDKTLIGVLIKDTYTIIGPDGKEIIKKYSDLENGYYEQSEKIIKLLLTVITAIGTVMIPRNSKEFSEGNFDAVIKNVKTSCMILLFISVPMILGIFLVVDAFVPIFFGDGYSKCILLIKLLSPLIIIIGFSNIFGLQYLIPSGQDKKFTIAVTCGAITNLVLNFIMIRFWWSIGGKSW
jgi:O-antigen/teichoic acid export membrane protein